MAERDREQMLWREAVANRPKHWVRAVTACNSRCLFCLDSDTPRNVYLEVEDIKAEIDRGLDEFGADKLILSGGEATLHPKFVELVGYAKERGYDRVQTVTNGYRFAEKDFYQDCVDAGLGEITFSLHGHDAKLHDRLTGTPDAFRRLIKGMVRALRERRVIVNVDVVINKQNVAVIDKIVELCISLGVTEFDLLHVIPQAAAFDNRDELFYDVREHLGVLQKVFRLNRHPRFVIWTNRFPVSYLEGLEDLIQDPHKMLDEVNGRRYQVRRYLDEGASLDCRDPERCPHCFIEPFCTTMDRAVARQHAASWEIWWLGAAAERLGELPFGCHSVGLALDSLSDLDALDLGEGVGLYLTLAEAERLPSDLAADRAVTLVAREPEQLDAWLSLLPDGVQVDIQLNQRTAPWLLANREALTRHLDRLRMHQPSHEHMLDATTEDVRDLRAFFQELGLAIEVSGLPICLVPNARWVQDRPILDAALFDEATGRLAIRPLAKHHVAHNYRAKSVRCGDCVADARCEGAHINMVRDQGLAPLTPLTTGDEARAASARLEGVFANPPERLSTGRAPEPVGPSLPGFAPPTGAPIDPLALIAREQMIRKAKKQKRLAVVKE
jgi:MoaA/NifB/PqqE/SkfB family radical SAM enzyme